MTDKLVPLSTSLNNATGTGAQNHSKTVKEDGRRFDKLLSESDAGPDADNSDGRGEYRFENGAADADRGVRATAVPANDDDISAGMDHPFGGESRVGVTPANPAIEPELAELSEDISSAYEQGHYADARQSIDAFLAAHPQILAAANHASVNGGSPSSHPLQVMSEILQFAEQIHDSVAGNDFGRARRIASVSARSINTLISGGSELLLPDTANELSTHFVQVLRAMPTESAYWQPLATGDLDQFVEAIEQTAVEFAEINPRLQVLFNDHAAVAESGPEMGNFGNVTELATGELIEQLDAWQAGALQRPVAMAAIQQIIGQIGSGSERSASEINGFIIELAEQANLETLFQLFGDDRAVLIDQLANKGAEAVVNDPWYEQAMIGVWNESGTDIPGRVEDAMRLSLSNGNQSMTRNMARDVFLAAGGPDGVLATVAASEIESAQQSLVDTVTTNSNRFNTALELARENGKVDELMLTLNRRGILNLARAFTDPEYFPLKTGEVPAAATLAPALSLEGLSDEAAVAVVNEMKALIETVKAASTAFSTAVANARAASVGSESSAWATTPDRALLQSARELDKSLAALQPYRDIIGDKNPESWQKLQDLAATAGKVAKAQISAAHQEIRVQRLTGDATTQQQEVRDTKLEFQQAIAYARTVGTADGADSLQKRRAIVKVYQAANEYQGALEGLRPLIRNSNDAASIDSQIRQIGDFATNWNEKYQAELLQQGLAIQDGDRVGDGFRIKQQALAALQPLAQDPVAFAAVIEQTYGQAIDPAKTESLRQKVLAGDMSWMPSIEFVGQETLNGAMGAYDGDIIYLQQELLNDPSAAVETLLEESGHALDNYFNGAPSAGGVDTAGDEGELFRRLVSGEALTSEQIAAMRNENDHGVIMIDGREIEVEFWNPFKEIGNLVESVVDTVVDVVEDVVDTVVDVVEDVVDTVVDVAEEIGDLVVDVVEGVGEVAWDLTVDVVEGVVDIGEDIVDFTVDVVEEVVEFGEEIVEFHLDIIEDVVEFHLDVLEDAWDFIEEEVLQSEWFPVVLMVASFVPGLNVVATIGRAVYAGYNTYQGVENGNWAQAAMGLVSLSGAFQDMGLSNEFVTAVGQVGEAVQTGLTVQELIETGDINALLDLAGQYLPEGSVGQQWVDRLQVGSAAYDAAERGDLLGAVGLGAGLVEDLSPDGTGFDSTLAQISDTALDGQALQNLIENGDYGLAAQLINDNYGELLSLNSETGDNLVQLGEVLNHLEDAKHLINDHDYLAAAQLLTNTASQHVGSPKTQALLQSTASALSQAGEGVAALESGDYNAALASFNQALGMPFDNETQAYLMQAGETAQRAQLIQRIFEDGDYFEAASLAATLGSSLSNNPDLQEHFNATAEVLMQAEGINDAIDSGDYLGAAALASELGASVVGNPNLQNHLQNTADVLLGAQSIDAAWQQGDYAQAAQIAGQLAGEVVDNPALQSHLSNAANVLSRAQSIDAVWQQGDYAQAAQIAAQLAGEVVDNSALQSHLSNVADVLSRAQSIDAAWQQGDYAQAAQIAGQLAGEVTDNPALQSRLHNAADVVDRASGINNAIEAGDYAAAADLSAELNAATINNPALTRFFETTSSLLGSAQGIRDAVEFEDYEQAAELAVELANEAKDLPVFRAHFQSVADNLKEAQTVADVSGADAEDAAAVASNTWVEPGDLSDDDTVPTANLVDTVGIDADSASADSTTTMPAAEIAPDRLAAIDQFVENNANETPWYDDNGGENVGAALIGDSSLGYLTVSEQYYLAGQSVEAWTPAQRSETLREATEAVRDNPTAGQALANAMSEPAADAARHFEGGGTYMESIGASGFRHEMLEHAVSLDVTTVIQNFEGVETRLGETAMEAMSTSNQTALLESVAAGRANQASADRLVSSMFFHADVNQVSRGDVAAAMAGALARLSHPDGNSAASSQLENRLTEVLETNDGRELLFGREVFPEQRAWALEQVSTNSAWTADALSRSWESDVVTTAYAHDVQDRYTGRGTEPQTLGGDALRNTIGQAIGLSPTALPGQNETAAQREARLSEGLNHRYYGANERIDLIAQRIREYGGDNAQVSVVPVTVTTASHGATVHNVFRVEGENGAVNFVDDFGLTYDDLQAWETESRLPKGTMSYATGLMPGAGLTDPQNTPQVVDSFWEHAGRIGDAVALGVGLVAGVALVVGTGGTAAVVAAGASGGYAASRAGAQLHDDSERGIDITDLSNPQVRSNWIDLAAGSLSVAAIGGGLRLANASRQGLQVSATAANSVAATQLVAEGLDAGAALNQIHNLATNWDTMSNGEKAAGMLEVAFWGAMGVASTSSGGARTQDALSFTQLSKTLQFGPDGASIIRRRQDNLRLFESDGFHSDRQAVNVTQQQVDWMLSGQSPLGFDSPQQFSDFQSEVQIALRSSGLADSAIEIKGTATSFYSENPHKPLGHHFDANPAEPADIDMGIASDTVIARMQELGFEPHPSIPTIYKTRHLYEAFPELAQLAQKWEGILGREVNFVARTTPDLGVAGPYDYRFGEN